MGAAFGAEFPRHGALEIAARELLGGFLGVFEAGDRHQHEQVGRAARDVLAFAAMALRLHHRLALGLIARLAARASAFEFHDALPVLLALFRRRAPGLAIHFWLFYILTRFLHANGCPLRSKPLRVPKRKGPQLALEPLNGRGIAGYGPEPELRARPPGRPRPGETHML